MKTLKTIQRLDDSDSFILYSKTNAVGILMEMSQRADCLFVVRIITEGWLIQTDNVSLQVLFSLLLMLWLICFQRFYLALAFVPVIFFSPAGTDDHNVDDDGFFEDVFFSSDMTPGVCIYKERLMGWSTVSFCVITHLRF